MARPGQMWPVLLVFAIGTVYIRTRFHMHSVQLDELGVEASGYIREDLGGDEEPHPTLRPQVQQGPQLDGPVVEQEEASRLSSDAAHASTGAVKQQEEEEQKEEEVAENEGDAGLSEMLMAASQFGAQAPPLAVRGSSARAAAGDNGGNEGNATRTDTALQQPKAGDADEATGSSNNGYEVAAHRALEDWLHPGPDVQPRPMSEHVTLTMTSTELSKRGAFFVPKVDAPEGERIWPPPDVKLQGRPYAKMYEREWNRARGSKWRKLLRLLPEEDAGKAWTFGTCAVVGNGGSLLLYDKGPEIDAHDAVIRFNRGITSGFQQHVGNRTTIRIVNRNNLGFIEPGDEAILQQVTAPDAFAAFVDLKTSTSNSTDAPPIFGIAPEFHGFVLQRYRQLLEGTNADMKAILGWRYQGEKLKWDSPATNGFYGIALALQRCRRVSVYGFARSWGQPSPSSSLLKLRYHYFDAEEPISAQHSRDDDEFMGLSSLVRVLRRRIRFGEPCIAACAGKMVDSAQDPGVCPQCPPGGWCSCQAWHPVPMPGHCFVRGRNIGQCFHRCRNSSVCPGGPRGFCPPRAEDYERTCAKVH